jgi:hypothetical protein
MPLNTVLPLKNLTGDYDQAYHNAKAYLTAMGLTPIVQIVEAEYQAGGYFAAMKGAADAMAFAEQENYIQPFWIALLYATAGEMKQCLNWLEKGYETKDPMHAYISDLQLKGLIQNEPRYNKLLRKMSLPAVEEK